MKLNARGLALRSVLIAVSLALSVLEGTIPLPLPGVKLGLANTVTLFALYTLSPLSASAILLCRCTLSAIFGGGITSFLFSLCGGISAILAMCAIKRVRFFSIYGVSIAGAAAHGIGQIFAACITLGTVSAVYYLPLLLLTSLVTGAVTAFISQILIKRLGNMFKN